MRRVLIVSIGYKPNLGGLETHLEDLVRSLNKRNWFPVVLTYKPVTTDVEAKFHERNDQVEIFRIPWVGKFFYKLVKNPFLEFIYLTPGLFFFLPLLLLTRGSDVNVIHSHGLIAGFPSVFWGKLFGKRVVTTTHSIYNFPPHGIYRKFATWVFATSDRVLTLSGQSKTEIERLGISEDKVKQFTYWIDLETFKELPKAKETLGWKGKFVVLSAGRLVSEKGISEILEAAAKWNGRITLAIAGVGPMEDTVRTYTKKYRNIIYLGKIDPEKMPLYYSAADVLIIPSVHEEGFGRIILESLACGTPVVGSKRGAIPEAMDDSVGRLLTVTPENIVRVVESLYCNPKLLKSLAKNTIVFARSRYSESNVEQIIKAYQG